MGTQQILLIVLSVIIVGIAVAVGITMFNAQSVNSNRNACIADMNNFAASAWAWYKTPVSHGGSGNGSTTPTKAAVGEYIGVGFDGTDSLHTDNGGYKITTCDATSLIILATGTGTSVDPRTTLTWATGGIVTDADTTP